MVDKRAIKLKALEKELKKNREELAIQRQVAQEAETRSANMNFLVGQVRTMASTTQYLQNQIEIVDEFITEKNLAEEIQQWYDKKEAEAEKKAQQEAAKNKTSKGGNNEKDTKQIDKTGTGEGKPVSGDEGSNKKDRREDQETPSGQGQPDTSPKATTQ